MIGYFLAILPIYLFIWLPISRMIYPPDRSGLADYDFNSSLFLRNENITCPPHKYSTYIYSREPLVIYIEGFLSAAESQHLIEISESEWRKSTVWKGGNKDPETDTTVRVSETALIPRTPMVQCIEERALQIQGWRNGLHLERLRTQRYGVGGHYVHHFDWKGGRGADRVSSFMVYVDADCDGGGTNFPRLNEANAKWCSTGFVECNESNEGESVDDSEQGRLTGEKEPMDGVTFRPLKGNAVFWENLRSDGAGHDETWHAGLPVLTGSKVGLNIWTWAMPGAW